MRTIIFRGKPKREADFHFFKSAFPGACSGGFAVGSLLRDEGTGRAYICCMILASFNCNLGNCQCSAIEVEPATVGQFTGVTDENGKRIFEGDILSVPSFIANESEITPPVDFDEGGFCAGNCFLQAWLSSGKFHGEVVGNVLDNPELMEVQN